MQMRLDGVSNLLSISVVAIVCVCMCMQTTASASLTHRSATTVVLLSPARSSPDASWHETHLFSKALTPLSPRHCPHNTPAVHMKDSCTLKRQLLCMQPSWIFSVQYSTSQDYTGRHPDTQWVILIGRLTTTQQFRELSCVCIECHYITMSAMF